MLLISTQNMERMAIALGLLTLTMALTTLTSSRSFVSLGKRLGWNFAGNRVYKSFYRYHAYYWEAFAIILFIHVSMGLLHIVLNTFVDDPDAYLHRYVLAAGLVGLLGVGSIVTSCRSLLGFWGLVFLKNPLSLNKFQAYYKLHSYFWAIFLATVIVHFWFGYLHAGGLWP